MGAAGGAVAEVVGADVAVVAVDRDSASTLSRLAGLPHGTGIAVVAEEAFVGRYQGAFAVCGVASGGQALGPDSFGLGADDF